MMRAFAGLLITDETRRNKSSGTNGPAAYHVFGKLRPHLATLMGNTGFHALLMRALSLANTEDPSLRSVRVKADGSLEGLEELQAQGNPAEIAEGSVELVAQLLGLLVAFIGEHLTLQMVREVWPKLSLNDLDFEKGDRK